ncbi:MAG: hypothetical protein AAFP19_04595 [Bacteroidota bacterium]
MLELFRTNQFIANVLLLFYIALLRFSVFLYPPTQEVGASGILSESLLSLVDPQSWLAASLSILLLFIQAILLNIIVSRYRMASELSLFPGLLYILLCSSIPEFLSLSPPFLANTFLLIALLELFDVYKRNRVAGEIFNAGFWLALASLCYMPYISFLLLTFIGLGILRAVRLRESWMLLIGFAVPYLLSNVYYFWNDRLADFWQIQFAYIIGWPDFPAIDLEISIKLAFFGGLLLFVVFNINRYAFKKNIQVQKNIQILYWSLLLAGMACLFVPQLALSHLLLLCPALAVFLSFSFLNANRQTSEAIHLILLVAVLLLQFKPLWI